MAFSQRERLTLAAVVDEDVARGRRRAARVGAAPVRAGAARAGAPDRQARHRDGPLAAGRAVRARRGVDARRPRAAGRAARSTGGMLDRGRAADRGARCAWRRSTARASPSPAGTVGFEWPLTLGDGSRSRVQVSVATDARRDATLSSLLLVGGAGVLIVAGLMLVLSKLLRRSVVRPVESLRAAMQRVEGGDYAARVVPVGRGRDPHARRRLQRHGDARGGPARPAPGARRERPADRPGQPPPLPPGARGHDRRGALGRRRRARPRPLQVPQRHPRAPVRRPGAARGGRQAARGGARRARPRRPPGRRGVRDPAGRRGRRRGVPRRRARPGADPRAADRRLLAGLLRRRRGLADRHRHARAAARPRRRGALPGQAHGARADAARRRGLGRGGRGPAAGGGAAGCSTTPSSSPRSSSRSSISPRGASPATRASRASRPRTAGGPTSGSTWPAAAGSARCCRRSRSSAWSRCPAGPTARGCR